jgi:hypothetical protein
MLHLLPRDNRRLLRHAHILRRRVRLYLPKTWPSSDPTYLQKLKDIGDRHIDTLKLARDNTYRGGQKYKEGISPEKSGAELEDEKGDVEGARRVVRAEVLRYAQREFYGDPNTTTGNPWHPNVAQTMFWM